LKNTPIIRINGDKHVIKSIPIKNNCAKESFCDDNFKVANPKLFLKNSNGKWVPRQSTVESDTKLELKWTARVSNHQGEDAYNAGFDAIFPSFVKLKNAKIEPGNDLYKSQQI